MSSQPDGLHLESSTGPARRPPLAVIAEALARAQSLHEISRAAVDSLCATLNVRRAAVLWREEGGGLRPAAAEGFSEGFLRVIADLAVAHLDRSAPHPLVINGRAAGLPPSLHALLAAEHLAALVVVPMTFRGGLISALVLAPDEPSGLNAHQLELAGSVACFVGFALDRWQAGQDLRRSEERLRVIFDQAAVGIAEISPEGRFLSANRRMGEILGYDPGELFAKSFQDLTHEPDLAQNLSLLDEAIDGRLDHYTLEKRYRRKDGEIVWANLSVGVVRDAAGRLERLVSVVEDVTQRKLLEDRLNQAQRMESIGRLAGGVAHDLNNLLTVMTGYASLAAQGLPGGDPRRSHVEQVLAAAASASGLTRRLLAFARKQVVAPAAVSLNDVILRCDPLMRRLLRADIEIRSRLAPDLWDFHADAGQVEQVLMNLAVNAQDAMPHGGVLSIETANVRAASALTPAIARPAPAGPGLPDLPPGECILLRVIDTGVGMDEATMRHIFEPFFTTKPVGEGTGLGLATVYAIVHQAGGVIQVRSTPGAGATFDIYWPRVAARAEQAQAPARQAVLVAEDQPAVRVLVAEVLRSLGFAVIEAKDGEEAARLGEEYRDDLRLLITDAVMPKMGGAELARKLTAARPDLRVLMMSGYTDDPAVRRDLQTGAIPFLPKPFSPDQLAAAVRDTLQAARPDRADPAQPPV